MGYWGWGFPAYVSVAKKKQRAARQAAKLAKKGAVLEPVTVQGRTIARSWWGRSWNANLERYADYSNRIGRGRSYVCHGMVLDLKIDKGVVNAVVAGTASKPYTVKIKIAGLPSADWKRLVKKASGQIDSIESLLAGEFSREYQDLFFEKKGGLFPSPRQIKFSCSCPDWASMCKHVAAALYGASARLDKKPELFFTLRGADMQELVGRAVRSQAARLLKRSGALSRRTLKADDGELESLFGIAMDSEFTPSGKVLKKRKTVRKKAVKTVKKSTDKKKTVTKKVIKKKAVKKKALTKKAIPKGAVKKSARKKAVKKTVKRALKRRPRKA